MLRETAEQQGVTLTGVLQPCGRYLEVTGVRTGVPRRTISRAARPLATVHIDLTGPCKPSMGGSVYLIMSVDSSLRWMRPYGMARKSETTNYVEKSIVDMYN